MKLFHEILLKYIIIDLAGHIDVGLDRFVKNLRLYLNLTFSALKVRKLFSEEGREIIENRNKIRDVNWCP